MILRGNGNGSIDAAAYVMVECADRVGGRSWFASNANMQISEVMRR